MNKVLLDLTSIQSGHYKVIKNTVDNLLYNDFNGILVVKTKDNHPRGDIFHILVDQYMANYAELVIHNALSSRGKYLV